MLHQKSNKFSYKNFLGNISNIEPVSHINHVTENNGIKGLLNSHVYIISQSLEIEKLKRNFPEYVKITKERIKFTDCYKISKADLIRYHDDLVNHHITRELAKADRNSDADEYSVRLLNTLFATANIQSKNFKYTNQKTEKYEHDQRAGKGKSQQLLNWLYDEDGYPGRINYGKIDFLRYAHKEAPVILLDPRYSRDNFTIENGIYTIEVEKGSTLLSLLNSYQKKYNKASPKHRDTICKGSFQDWKEFSNFALGEARQKTENLLREHQTISILEELDIDTCSATTIDENDENEPVKKRIEALYNALKLFSDKHFFKKFTKEKGVLQAEQYFTWLFANIHAEITSLKKRKYLPEKTQGECNTLYIEIGKLLTIRDFLLDKDLVHREARINLTKKEITDLFIVLKANQNSSESIQEKLSENYVAKLLGLESGKDVSKLITFLSQENNLCRKNQKEFLSVLKEFSPQNISVEISTILGIKKTLYNLTYYIPGSSLWLKHLNPANSRVQTSYKDNSICGLLYCANKEIKESRVSREIRESLNLTTLSDFVPSKHEAKCIIDDFRKARNMMGAKEKFIYRIKKNRFIWLLVCIPTFIIIISLSITSRVLIGLNVGTPAPINAMLNGFRGFTESFAFIAGLDTFLDLTILRALDFVALGIRYIDQYLLGSIIRSTLRLVTGVIIDISNGVKYSIKSCWQSLIDHGLWGSLVIASDNIKSSITKERVADLPKSIFTYLRDKVFTKEEISEPYGSKIPVLCLFYNLHKNYKIWKENKKQNLNLIDFSFKNPSNAKYQTFDNDFTHNPENIKSEKEKCTFLLLICDSWLKSTENIQEDSKVELIRSLQTAIKSFINEQNDSELLNKRQHVSATFQALGNTKYELLKLEPQLQVTQQAIQIKKDLNNVIRNEQSIRYTLHNYSRVFLRIAASLRKDLFQSEVDYQDPTKSFIQNDDKGFKKADLERRINIIGSLIQKIDNSKISVAQSIAEPIFSVNNSSKELKLHLELYKNSLEQLKQSIELSSEIQSISPIALNLLDFGFKDHLSNAFILRKSFNKLQYNGFHGTDLDEFSKEFALITLFAFSSKMKEVAANLMLYHGKNSSFDVAGKHFMHFIKEYQNPKTLILSFLAISALERTSLHIIPDSISQYMEILTGMLGSELLEQEIEKTITGKLILHTLYEKAELPRDLLVQLRQINSTLCGSINAEEENTKTRVKKTLNTLCSLLFTVIGVNTIKSVAAEKGYDTKQTLQRCYVPYFAIIGTSLAIIDLALFMQQRIIVNTIVNYALVAMSVAAFITCCGVLIYSSTLKDVKVEEAIHQYQLT